MTSLFAERKERNRAVFGRVLARLDAAGHRETADIARLIDGLGLRIAVHLLASSRWRVERGSAFDRVLTMGRGSYPFPLVARSPIARAVTSDPARCAAISNVPSTEHLRRWTLAATAEGLASDSPIDVLRPALPMPARPVEGS